MLVSSPPRRPLSMILSSPPRRPPSMLVSSPPRRPSRTAWNGGEKGRSGDGDFPRDHQTLHGFRRNGSDTSRAPSVQEGDGRAGSCGACASLVLRLCGAPSESSCQRMMFAQPVTVRLDKLHEKKKEKDDALSHRDDADGRGPSTSTCGAPCRTSAHPWDSIAVKDALQMWITD